MRFIMFIIIGMSLMACSGTSGHPPHSHTCYTSDMHHGYTEREYQEIQEEMDQIRFMMDDLERRVR